jgi:hypothetical protein
MDGGHEKKMGIIKIALGVFLGIAAFAVVAYLLTHAGEIKRNYQESNATSVVMELTPAKVLERCGLPVKDVSDIYLHDVIRLMTYKGPRGNELTLSFTKSGMSWLPPSIVAAYGSQIEPINLSNREILLLLPCLEKQ